MATANEFGYIYAIQSEEGGPVKIGSTYGPPKDRLKVIQRGHPFILQLVWCVGIRGDVRGVEKVLHSFFKPEHIRAEWFYPSPRLIECLERLSADVKETVA